MEWQFGSTDHLKEYDGTVYQFERNTRNYVYSVQTPLGILTQEGYDARGNLQNSKKIPATGTGPSPTESATYPSTCANLVTCNEPISVTDANGNQSSFTYDPNHGGVLTVTEPV
jgi:hypothetical protein